MRTIGGKAWLALSTGVSGCYRCSCFCCRCLESTVGQEHSTLHFRTRSLDHFRTEWRPSAIWMPGIRLIALQAQICHIPVFCPHAGYSSPRPSALGPYLPTSLLPLCLPHHSAPPTAPPYFPSLWQPPLLPSLQPPTASCVLFLVLVMLQTLQQPPLREAQVFVRAWETPQAVYPDPVTGPSPSHPKSPVSLNCCSSEGTTLI